jgi:hypothetical protein
MAPTPGENYDNDKQYPPDNETLGIPSVVTSTFTYDPYHTATIAWKINSYTDGQGQVQTFTISAFTNLADASAVAYKLNQALESMEAAYSGYRTYDSSSPTSAAQENYPPASPIGYSSAASTAKVTDNPQTQTSQKNNGPPVMVLAVGIIVPIIVCIITITACIFLVSHYRRKAKALDTVERSSSEMREVGPGSPKPTAGATAAEERAYLTPPSDAPQMTTALAAVTAPRTQGQDQPVILSTTMNNTYYTGIDTSDHVSLSDQRSMASRDTFGEEPPPPYRPRSVPPISRETSVRTSTASTPNRNSSVRSRCETLSGGSIIRRSNEVRSPFDDPEEEDEDEDEDDISEASTIRGASSHRETDRLSVVSDLSYQDEPMSSHSHV